MEIHQYSYFVFIVEYFGEVLSVFEANNRPGKIVTHQNRSRDGLHAESWSRDLCHCRVPCVHGKVSIAAQQNSGLETNYIFVRQE